MPGEQFLGRFKAVEYLEEYYPDREIGSENTALQVSITQPVMSFLAGRGWK